MYKKESLNSNLKLNLPENFLRQIQVQKQQLLRIRQQQQTISTIDQNLRKKNQEILRLKTLVDKYSPYYKKYIDLSTQFTQKCAKLTQKQKQASILMQQIKQLIGQNNLIKEKYDGSQQQRLKLFIQQKEIQKVNGQIQETFKLYQDQCRRKETNLLKDLQKAYKQVTQLNKRIDQYEMKVFQNQQLKRRLNANTHSQPQSTKISNLNMNTSHLQQLRREISSMKLQLKHKQQQLLKYKILNKELSIQFDKSVGKICEFQKQLSRYRQQNHELQKMLNLFIQKQKYEKMHLRQLQKASNLNEQQSQDKQ